MKLSLLFLYGALFTPSIIASPSRRLRRRSSPISGLKASDGDIIESGKVLYDANWAGAAIASPPSKKTFIKVQGTFNVPIPKAPPGEGNGNYSAAVWVGIDGFNTYNDLVQSGIEFSAVVTDSGTTTSAEAWWEWYPDPPVYLNGFDVSPGDNISVSIKDITPTTAKLVMKNKSTKKSASAVMSASSPDYSIQGVNAEWIVEDFTGDGALVPFANFGTVTFTDCKAGYKDGSEGAKSAELLDIEDDENNILTKSTIVSDSEVTVKYVGK